ncbi:MAG: FGGY-family carbohydrate kinase [Gammaproteobacteria bacterium]|nr:FGGY-family carbohydrate kinase [Gammaproteobacteria bacterium]
MPEGTSQEQDLFIGIDLGTSGCRAIVIDQQAKPIANQALSWPAPDVHGAEVQQDARIWWDTLQKLLSQLCRTIDVEHVRAICLDGTSGTVLLCDKSGTPLAPALMYNDARATAEAASLKQTAPPDSAVHSASSGLAKLLWLKQQDYAAHAHHFLHQADWIYGQLSGQFGTSDHNNALKTGYDPVGKSWPVWMDSLDIPAGWLPKVVAPGTPIGSLSPEITTRFGFPADIQLVTGTTDSTAAFLATGASRPGEAVTSLGSTLVLKIICERPIFDTESGVYSQPCGQYWLVGGGSNSGGKVLRDFFSDEKMAEMQTALDFDHPTGLDYYPLPQTGERFPINDPDLSPRLSPRPDDDVMFFQGLLEGIAQIERQGYEKLRQLGASWPTSIRTMGGGAKNDKWTWMRQALLNVPISEPIHTEAAYGVALLSKNSMQK